MGRRRCIHRYDRLLDVSRAVTGNLFFVPPAGPLEGLADGEAAPGGSDAAPAAGSLNIGSLRGVSQDE